MDMDTSSSLLYFIFKMDLSIN